MIESEPYNLLPLDTWRKIFSLNPWHFWGIRSNTGVASLRSECLDIMTEYSWQGDQSIGRHDIRQAIIGAENISREWSGYWPAPRYGESDVTWVKGRSWMQGRVWGAQPDWRFQGFQLDEMKLIALGIEKRVVIDLTAPVVYTDPDSDGLDERFTLTLTVPDGTSPEQIAIYFTEADRVDEVEVSERWRIQPVITKVSGTIATVTGPRWLCVRPEVYENTGEEGVPADDDSKFVEDMAAYLRVNDPTGHTLDTSQLVLTWENRPCHGWWCLCGCTTMPDPLGDPAAVARAMARGAVRQGEIGLIYAAESSYNSSTGFWNRLPSCWEPDRVTARWFAGVPLVAQQAMNPAWARIIARLTAAEMGRPICACETANKELYVWQFDLATATSEAEQYQIAPEDLANPIGTRRGHVAAWKWISRNEVTVGFLPG